MSDTETHSGVPDSDMLAAEYVLGVLTHEERRDAERRVARDAVFARAVHDWEARLLPWANGVASVAPPDTVWERIVATLPGQLSARSGQSTSWRSSLAFWRGLAFGAGGLAAASLVALFLVTRAPVATPPLMASIDGGGHRHFIATIDTQHGQIIVSPAAFAAVPDRVPELWIIIPGSAPKSLGLLQADRAVTIPIPASLRPQTNTQAVLAVSIEPPGGSTTGAPTGPVVAQGKVTNL
jgi:anti-sigma-K factor RskA